MTELSHRELMRSCWRARSTGKMDGNLVQVGDRIIVCYASSRKANGTDRVIRILHYTAQGMVYMRRADTSILRHFQRIGDDVNLDCTFYNNCQYEIRKGYDQDRWASWVKPGMRFTASVRTCGQSTVANFKEGSFVINTLDLEGVNRTSLIPAEFLKRETKGHLLSPEDFSFPKRKVEPCSKVGFADPIAEAVARKERKKKAKEPEKKPLDEQTEEDSRRYREMMEQDQRESLDRAGKAIMRRMKLRTLGYTDHDVDGPHPEDQILKTCCLLCGEIVPKTELFLHEGGNACCAKRWEAERKEPKAKKEQGYAIHTITPGVKERG